ncbi:hypothetical protein [Rhodovulum visakhapatnamense]|uniref:Cytochrome P450 n=1 Tax=Rhodovulum visakhapatnamense TaxID=364297 RepID=A0A4R8G9J8_9RHOB|nr:hypothetical protein [Rhodovulum visakhapatnamense]TDX33394.1 cytochrome P450 [Rhodovulum visakhapatnamense]
MPVVNSSAWDSPDRFVTDPDDVAALLRDPRFTVGQLATHLDQIAARGGPRFPHLAEMARHAFAFQTGEAHLAARRATAAFFAAPALTAWAPVAHRAFARALDRLEAAEAPDLMRDYCEGAFLDFVRAFAGCPGGTDERVLELIRVANNTTQPMLSLRTLGRIDAALGELLGYLSTDPMPGVDPSLEGFPAFLERRKDRLSDPAAAPYIALSALVGSHTVAQSLALALYGLLLGDAEHWRAAAEPGWTDAALDRMMSLYPSTLTLVRMAEDDVRIGDCPFHKGEAAVMDVVAANAELRRRVPDGSAHLSFGTGPHKCPGAPLSQLFLGRAIPALARRFPQLALHRDGVRFHVTPLVQYPVALPVTRDARSRRLTGRMVEIRDLDEARAIVNDDDTWSPPRMEPYLTALADRSGRDLDLARLVARNAMFFMSGERHAAIRRAVADSLGGNRLARWQPLIEAETQAALARLAAAAEPDLIADYADPIFRGIAGPVLGISPADPERFDVLAPILQDVLEPWLPIRELDRLQDVIGEILAGLRPPATDGLPGTPLLTRLMDEDLPDTDETDIKALVLVMYGASFNMAHTLGNILHHLLTLPPEDRKCAADPAWIDAELERLISLCASPKYIYRMARGPARIGRIEIRPHETLRLQLLSIDRGVGTGNLAFGHGLHRCVGAALSKRMLRTALPALFARFPGLALKPQRHRYFEMTQTVALATLPCRLGSTGKDRP